MNSYFCLAESSVYRDKYVLRFCAESEMIQKGLRLSYDVLPARLMNLPYDEYLRYTRDKLGAELIGKGRKYITPYFDKTPATQLFVKVLNKRMQLIMLEREHPYTLQEEPDGTITKIPFNQNEDNT